VAGRWLRRNAAPPYERERWTTPDGDFLDLDVWRGRAGTDPTAPRVLVLHGLEGCSGSACVVESCRRLDRAGMRPVALNFRSRSGEPNRARRFYHSGETGDLSFVLDRLSERSPDAPLAAVGFSLGGNVLLKHLGERGPRARRRLDAAVAVSVPYRLGASARRMERGLGRLYGRHFLRSLRRSLREKARVRGHDYDLERLSRVRTLREFDEAFTAPVHGFDDADDYYRRCSSARFLSDVRVPTLLLQARDDPFLPPGALPEGEMESNPRLTPRITDRGGHAGFVEGTAPWRPRFWAEREAARFLASTLAADDTGRVARPAAPGDGPPASNVERHPETPTSGKDDDERP
jgi:predicted alpha/beta-fold hydrolase